MYFFGQDIYNFIEKVPRAPKGVKEGGQWVSEWLTGGKVFDLRKKEMRIPPAWTDVQINKDKTADLQATGYDSKGRKQYVYSENAVMAAAAAKFARNEELLSKALEIEKQNTKNLKSDDPHIRECAQLMSLIMATGIRPGSDTDTGAEKKAYGATTLEGRHVVKMTNIVRLRFVGKKGVDLDIPIFDNDIADMLIKKKAAAGSRGSLFSVSDSQLRDYVKTLDGGGFKTKDFRTLKGTAVAMEEIKKHKKAKNITQYKKSVKAISKKVASVLGNTPAIALKSYINPFVFLSIKP